MEITKVQRWVASAVLFVVGMGLSIPLAWVSPHMDREKAAPPGASPGLWVMSGVTGLATVAGILLIHRRFPLSPWLLLGLIPAAIAAPYVF